MNIRPFVCIIAVVLFALLHSGTSEEEKKKYKCYDCDSRLNGNCANNVTTSTKQTNCTSNVICSKCDYEFSNATKFVIRGCGIFDPQPSVELNNGDCTLCKGDLCNNANMATISMTALGCLASFWAIRSILTNSY